MRMCEEIMESYNPQERGIIVFIFYWIIRLWISHRGNFFDYFLVLQRTFQRLVTRLEETASIRDSLYSRRSQAARSALNIASVAEDVIEDAKHQLDAAHFELRFGDAPL